MYKRYYTPFQEEAVVCEAEPEVITPRKLGPRPGDQGDCDERQWGDDEDEHGCCNKKQDKSYIFGKLAADDIILIGILILLLMEDRESRDVPLLLAIGFLFIMGFLDEGGIF